MAGAMRKAFVYLGLVEDDEERYEDYAEDETAVRGQQDAQPAVRRTVEPIRQVTPSAAATGGATSLGRQGGGVDVLPRVESPAPSRITTLHPRTYNEARTIGEHFREGTPVIMNLSEMDDADAKRLVDFAAGLIFGLRGSIERVTQKVFLLSPADVQITAEDKERIVAGGFFNQS